MSAIDLKPLTKEVIQKMGYSTHDLWVVKINDEIYGPFEVESLKQYATENEKSFHEALASRLDTNDWQPFFNHAFFQDIEHSAPEVREVIPSAEEGPFWILYQGQKAGPLSKMDVEKKLEMGILTLSDLVSLNDGHTWQKFHELSTFCEGWDGDELPLPPLELTLEKHTIDLPERPQRESINSLASLAYLDQKKDKTVVLNLEEIDLKNVSETEVSRSLKWALPSAVAGVVALVVMGNFILSPSENNDLALEENTPKKMYNIPKNPTPAPARQISNTLPRPANRPSRRMPASVPKYERSELTRPHMVRETTPRYPIEAEPRYEEPQYNEPDPRLDPVSEAEYGNTPEPQEHSLIGQPESLDQAMNNAAYPEPVEDTPMEQPVIEEASDF